MFNLRKMSSQVIVEYNKRLSLYRIGEKFIFDYLKKEFNSLVKVEIKEDVPVEIYGDYFFEDVLMSIYLRKNTPHHQFIGYLRQQEIIGMLKGFLNINVEEISVRYE